MKSRRDEIFEPVRVFGFLRKCWVGINARLFVCEPQGGVAQQHAGKVMWVPLCADITNSLQNSNRKFVQNRGKTESFI